MSTRVSSAWQSVFLCHEQQAASFSPLLKGSRQVLFSRRAPLANEHRPLTACYAFTMRVHARSSVCRVYVGIRATTRTSCTSGNWMSPSKKLFECRNWISPERRKNVWKRAPFYPTLLGFSISKIERRKKLCWHISSFWFHDSFYFFHRY